MRNRLRIFLTCLMTLTLLGRGVYASETACQALNGINLAGGEFGSDNGREGKDFFYPKLRDFDAIKRDGFSIARVPFRWERVQSDVDREPNLGALLKLDATVSAAEKAGVVVILDMHNSAFYGDKNLAGNQALQERLISFWTLIAKRYSSSTNIFIGLMNEPYKIDADEWASIAQRSVTAIRQTGFRGKILVPGTIWSGAHSWFRKVGEKSNAEALSNISDPLNNVAIDIHQYFDSDFSGTHLECRNDRLGVTAIQKITDWLRSTGQHGFLSEYGSASNETCTEQLKQTLEIIRDNPVSWSGSTYWAGGSKWSKDYPYLIDMTRNLGMSQYQVLRPLLCIRN